MNNKTALVRVNIFSGRRNPEWQLDAEDTRSFLLCWEQAVMHSSVIKAISRLGYSGCTVTIDDKRWELYNGFATAYHLNTVTSKIDEGRSMERLLLKHAPEEIVPLVKFN